MEISSQRPNETREGYQKRIQEHIDALQTLADEAIRDAGYWKRRALEAEKKVKSSINDLNNDLNL